MKKSLVAVATMLTASGCSWFVTQPDTHNVSKLIIKHSSIETPLPPSFLGHPVAYMAALFSQLTIFSVATAVSFFLVSSLNLRRDSCWRDGKRSWKSLVNVYRVSIISYMMVVLLASSSNLLIYLGWNEVDPTTTMPIFFTVDKMCKSILVAPILFATYLLVTNNEVITMQLSMSVCNEPLWPPRQQLREHAWMILWILVLALGVTMAKMGEYVAL